MNLKKENQKVQEQISNITGVDWSLKDCELENLVNEDNMLFHLWKKAEVDPAFYKNYE